MFRVPKKFGNQCVRHIYISGFRRTFFTSSSSYFIQFICRTNRLQRFWFNFTNIFCSTFFYQTLFTQKNVMLLLWWNWHSDTYWWKWMANFVHWHLFVWRTKFGEIDLLLLFPPSLILIDSEPTFFILVNSIKKNLFHNLIKNVSFSMIKWKTRKKLFSSCGQFHQHFMSAFAPIFLRQKNHT